MQTQTHTHHLQLVAGPCSAESEAQIKACAKALRDIGGLVFRAGLWKPRTTPGTFQGVGEKGILWLLRAERETGLMAATEVATPEHLRLCLDAGLRCFWIGARTTANPIMVQELADLTASRPSAVSRLYVKNPVNPDIELWIGAIERFRKAGLTDIAAVHRGFSTTQAGEYRNAPLWSIPIELRRRMPDLPILCDASHIAGKRALIPGFARQAVQLGFDGLMLEVHPDPETALSDAQQQLTPNEYHRLIASIDIPTQALPDRELTELRQQIDEIDAALWQLVLERQQAASRIGIYKRRKGLPVLQTERYAKQLEARLRWAREHGLPPETARQIMQALHEAAVLKQLTES